jgi:hypothetical protein
LAFLAPLRFKFINRKGAKNAKNLVRHIPERSDFSGREGCKKFQKRCNLRKKNGFWEKAKSARYLLNNDKGIGDDKNVIYRSWPALKMSVPYHTF